MTMHNQPQIAMSDTPETDALADMAWDGATDDYSAYAKMLHQARRLERERNAYKEQRDRLAEALEAIQEYWNRDQNETAMADACWHAIHAAEQALAAVKGGSDE